MTNQKGANMAVKKRNPDASQSADSNGIVYGGLDDMVGILLQRAHNTAFKKFTRDMGEDFKPGFYTTLSLLEKNPGMSQKALAHALRRDPSTLVPFLDQLEKREWLVRKRSETDRRAHELYITAAGASAAKTFDKQVNAIEARIEALMGAEENRKFKELLMKFERLHNQE